MKVALSLVFTEVVTALGVNALALSLVHAFSKNLDIGSGTSDGQNDRIFSAASTASTTPVSLDLAGSLTSAVGSGTVAFAEWTWIIIENTGTADILVGGGATPLAGLLTVGTTDSWRVQPGGFHIAYAGPAGVAIANGSTDLLWITAASGTPTYNIIVVGRSA